MTIITGGVTITGFVQFTANYVPDSPTALTATWTTNVTNTVSLQFTTPVTAGSGPILSYTAVSNPAGFTATVAANTNTVIIPGLSSSTYYVFNMYATNFAGNSLLSTASNVVYGLYSSPILLSSYSVPTAPTSISAIITSTNATSTPSALVKFLPGTSQIPAASYSVLANGTLAGTSTTLPTTSYSGYFNGGSSSYLSFSTTPNPLVGIVDFTIEMWAYPLATTNGSMMGNWTQLTSPGDHGMKISYGRTSAGKFEFFYSSSGQSSPGVMVSASTYAANAWYHVAAVRVGSTVTLYVNGTSAVSGTYSNDMYEQYLYIGTENPGYNTTWFNGYISNVRIVRYLAVYTGNFTPPTGPLAVTQSAGTNISSLSVANTVTMLTLQNATSIVDNSAFNRSITVSGATTSTNQPFDPYAYVVASNLSPVTSYTFRAYGTNLVGDGALSTTSSAITTYVTPGSSLYAYPGTYSWVAPDNVTSISVVVVGAGGCGSSNGNTSAAGADAYFISSSVLYANGGSGSSGGQGGTVLAGTGFPGGNRGTHSGIGSGGGGAGGYLGAGGIGASTTSSQAGSGGGGGGGGQNSTTQVFYGGGGVGLFGLGCSGAGGAINAGGTGSGGGGGSGGLTSTANRCGALFGGGGAPISNGGYAGGGGALAYINNFSVVPGSSYTMVVPAAGVGTGAPGGGRIIWPGQIRAYPSTAVTGCTGATLLSSYVPKAPTIGTVTANSGTRITVRYTVNTVNNTPGPTSFTSVVTPGNITTTVSTAGSYYMVVDGLNPSTTYSASVYASNQYGNSAYSGSASTTTAVASSSIAYTIPGTYSWVVPANVTAVSVLAVGGGSSGRGLDGNNNNGGASSFTMAALPNTVHVSASGGSGQTGGSVIAGTGFSGGGGGGAGCSGQSGGGGGAGGYTAAGGAGGGGAGNDGAASTGGGGGGGRGQTGIGGGGGGVGLFGKCGNGTGGVAPAGPGTGGSNGTTGGYGNGSFSNVGGFGGFFGGGGGASFISGGAMPGGGGGALAYVNNVSVTAGSSYTVVVGAGGATTNTAGGSGAVRIVWPGQFRSFPSTGVDSGYDSATDTLNPSKTYVPGAPVISSAVASSGTGITVNFTAPPSSYYFTPITSYTAVATTGTTSISRSAASAGSILILGLTPLTRYNISVYATSVYGSSTSSISTPVTTLVASGEAVYTTPGSYSWVAPANVTSVSMVLVGGGGSGRYGNSNGNGGGDSYFASSAFLLANGGGAGIQGTNAANSGAAGGAPGGSYSGGGTGGGGGSASAQYGTGGGGGAGGYSGTGGYGGWGQSSRAGIAGAGGGGGGGANSGGANNTSAAGGGGVGLYGQGCNGAAGVVNDSTGYGTGGGGGSGGSAGECHGMLGCRYAGNGGAYGGGGGGYKNNTASGGCGGGGGGGGLVYLNNYTVIPGSSYPIVVGAGGVKTNAGTGGGGAIRIIWPGTVRSFPSTLAVCSGNL